ncbi:leucine-rich repeat domain-containing protein [Anaerolineales bacterium HSG24]|nr:leucine-rich repeat domain-containing protein [Anaerolineales bacterium HSG24]
MTTNQPNTMSRDQLLTIINQAKAEGRTELNLHRKGISELRISELPAEIGQLTNLTSLSLWDNQLSQLPNEIGQLTNLTSLSLSYNQLSQLPNEIGQLTNLTDLSLRSNQLSQLPAEIVQLTNLTSLDLRSNQLSQLPAEIVQLTNLTSLYLSDNQLSQLPAEIVQLTNLTSLYLSFNQLSQLPAEIVQLTNLTDLDLSYNQLSQLPAEIGQLTNLTSLDLRSNQLSQLPAEIVQLTNLTSLYLSFNQLSQLPAEIGQLTNLTSLYLSYNQLSQLPAEIGQLTNLTSLNLRSNQLSQLPAEIGQLTNLTSLSLWGNQLSQLPNEIGQLTNLTSLDLDFNPLNPAMQSVYEAGLKELQTYLRSLEDNAEPLYEAKLVLVGEGGVGKTTLLKALTDQDPQANEPTTHGVEIALEPLYLNHPTQDGVEIQFNAWDFGGQEIYRVTHQFFFSERAIYLLVWEPRKGVQQCQVEDWLKMIQLRVGEGARVIIVSTHCCTGERIARIDEPVFRRDYGKMIVDFIEVDSLVDDEATGDKIGMAQLKKTIAKAAKDLTHVGMLFNRDWRAARDELLSLTEPRLPYQEFAAVCQTHGLNEIATKTLATLMHDLGYIVYYGDDEHLKEDVVLQPEWLTKAIGFVLEDRITNQMEGILLDNRLKDVWLNHAFANEPHYESFLYPFFLRLMEKYDVSYRLEEGNASLVAQQVPQVRPALPWLPEEDIAPNQRRISLVCVLDDLPPGLVPWMIVRTHDYAYQQPASDNQVHLLHWQKGMFLRHHDHGQAMLELRGREFHLYVEAVWPQYFMNVLHQTLQTLITDNWPGLQDRYEFTAPCANPEYSRPVLIECHDPITAQTLGIGRIMSVMDKCFSLGVKAVQPTTAGADPDNTCPIGEDCIYQIGTQTLWFVGIIQIIRPCFSVSAVSVKTTQATSVCAYPKYS